MLVFLSWSGERSESVALELKSWLEKVLQAVEPWISTEISKGARWGPEVASKLEHSKVGIICVTKENAAAPWLLFEAGALAKTGDALACGLLLDVTITDLPEALRQFQLTERTKEDVRRLLSTINQTLAKSGGRPLSEATLSELFEDYWPRLSERLEAIAQQQPAAAIVPAPDLQKLLSEILESLQRQDARLSRIEQATSHQRAVRSLADALRERPANVPEIEIAKGLGAGAPVTLRFTPSETDGMVQAAQEVPLKL